MRPPTDTGLVSVIVPAFNAAATLRETIESAQAQTYRNLEILVVDDGSRDRTAVIAAELARRDPRMRLLRKPNCGPAAARNHGIAHARGELIAPLDADDLWHPDKITEQVAALRRAGERHALVYTWIASLDGRGCFTGRYTASCHEGAVYPILLLYNFITTASSPLMRRRCVLEVGGFDESLRGRCEDLMLFLSLAERYDFAVVPRLLTGYREAGDSMSQDFRAMRQGHDQIMCASRRKHRELPDRLLRWSRSGFCARQAAKSLRRRRFLPAMAALGRAIRHDPAFPLTLPLRRKLLEFLSGERDPLLGQPFLPPRAEATSFKPPRNSWLETRRRTYAATVRAKRPVACGWPDPTSGPRVMSDSTTAMRVDHRERAAMLPRRPGRPEGWG